MEPLPIACTLDTTDQSSRRDEWRTLFEEARVEAAPSRAGVAMKLDASGDARERIERLIALEQNCCAWIQWTLRDDGGTLAVDATAHTPEGVTLLQDWFVP